MEFSNILSSVVSRIGENAENQLSAVLTTVISSDVNDVLDNELEGLIAGVEDKDLSKCIAGAIKIFNNVNNNEVADFVVASQAQEAAILINGVSDIVSGEITADDLIEKVVDMAECRLAAELDVVVDIGIELLPEIATVIYPPLGPVVATVQPFIRQIAPKIKETAGKVLHHVSNFAKEVGKSFWNTIKKCASDILQ